LYRGLLTTVYRQFPSFIIYFGSYDVIKTTLLQQQQLQYQNLLASIIAGGIAGSLSWAIIYPIDLIKTRIQSLSPTTVSVTLNSLSGGGAATSYYHIMKNEHIMIQSITSSIINQHGWKALYSGFGITILRAFPMNAVIFPTYELTLATLQHIL
jgi:solute carrier family 25 carnitine/acylcarnitine transporter 20/29